MGTFDGFADVTGQLKREADTITLTFSPGLPVTGQGTVQWNIPAPAQGCAGAEEGRGAYCGMVILLSPIPLTVENTPVDGTFYTNDPTANPDLHVGDKIGNALVVGAFYEGEKRSRGEQLSTSLIISDVIKDKPYYVAGYAVDCQGRYHSEGQRAYSDIYGCDETADINSYQVIQVNSGEGALPTDATHLIPGAIYEFDVEVNEDFPQPGTPADVINVKIDGTDAQTYEELVDAINSQLKLAENPPQSPVPPNTGSYWYDLPNKQLAQFNGTSYDPIDSICEPTDPANVAMGTYWYNPDTGLLQRWNIPSPTGWNLVDKIEYHEDPTAPQCDDYWFNGVDSYKWNGTTWCETTTFVTDTDPGCAPVAGCGSFWYDETNMVMYEWDINQERWVERTAIYWPEAPNALSDGTYWFDLDTELVYERAASAWSPTAAIISDIEPTPPLAPDQLLYNPVTEELKQWNDTTMLFEDRDVLVWDGDPASVESCDLWWNSATDLLFTWDVVNSEWDSITDFTQSPTDPTLANPLPVDTLWYNTTDNTLSRWDGGDWVLVTHIEYPTDPQNPALGTAWQNTETGLWYVWDTPNAGWNEINPIDVDTDPNSIPQGTFWYDSTNNILNQRVGSSWVAIPFTAFPIAPTKGDTWFDSSDNSLYIWNGSEWVEHDPKAWITLNSNGDLEMSSRARGSCACIMIMVPDGSSQHPAHTHTNTGYADFHSYGHYDSYSENAFASPPLQDTDVTVEGFLWNNMATQIYPQVYGIDGLDRTPAYDVEGVGNDGSPDERRELADSIRAQLGYPVIEVELTPYQMDEAIQGALESLRKRSEIAYKRGWFFLDIQPGAQSYRMTNKKAGFNKIVSVNTAHRFTSAFLSSAHGAGVYGQIVLQHLYNMGTYDLTSFHLVAQYIEQMEHLFATRLTFNWNESTRVLHLHQSFVRHERILLDCAVERTEQELLKDRWCKTWIEKYALSQARYMLAEIRGKYASLPGAGGGVSLNAAELITRADQDMADLYQQLDDFVASQVEDWGMGTTFVIG
jgi:hypothetical protein